MLRCLRGIASLDDDDDDGDGDGDGDGDVLFSISFKSRYVCWIFKQILWFLIPSFFSDL